MAGAHVEVAGAEAARRVGQLVERPAQPAREDDGHDDREAGRAERGEGDDPEHAADPGVGGPGRRLQADDEACVGVGLGDQVTVALGRAGQHGRRAVAVDEEDPRPRVDQRRGRRRAAGLDVEGDGVGLLLEAAVGLVADEAGGDDGERQAEGEDDDEDGAEDGDQQPPVHQSASNR